VLFRSVRETSWANVRDRVAVGHFDGAHMLAPMPIAFNLGLTPLSLSMIAPMALGLGGNAVTVSNRIYRMMSESGPIDIMAPAKVGAALGQVIGRIRAGEGRRPIFAVVHPYSGHNYELRYWLAACGIDPEQDVEIVIVPPPLMADALKAGSIDGFCVGEPWNTAAVSEGVGHIVTVKATIWRSSPEKVLGLSARFAMEQPDRVARLIRAAYRASVWCGDPANIPSLARLLARTDILGLDERLVLPALTGLIATGGGEIVEIPDFFLPNRRAATFPWQSHALWFYSQMVRWGDAAYSPKNVLIARDSFRPDLYRQALAPLGAPVPSANLKVEGALTRPVYAGTSQSELVLGPDGFFDGRFFDPDHIDRYLDGQ
jgi:NitT/TauT family transport system ATP-binding protein